MKSAYACSPNSHRKSHRNVLRVPDVCYELQSDNKNYLGIISGPGSFAVQFGDHLRSWDHLRTRTAPFYLLGYLCPKQVT